MSSLSELGCFELPRAGRPLPLIACTRGDPGLTRLNNCRVRLVVHCSVLAQHTLSFHARPGRIRDARCILCECDIGNSFHFVCCCPAFQPMRSRYFPLSSDPLLLFEQLLGVEWIQSLIFQRKAILLLAELRAHWLGCSQSQ